MAKTVKKQKNTKTTRGGDTPAVTSDVFKAHLEKASKIVSTWPAWKQKLLGGNAIENIHEHPLVKSARECAIEESKDKTRKGSDKLVFEHLENVAFKLIAYKCSPEVIAAGYLHDHMEDFGWSINELDEKFGTKVCDMVIMLSEPSKNYLWEYRNADYIINMTKVPKEVCMVSLADKLDNTLDLINDIHNGRTVESVLKRGFEANLLKLYLLKEVYTRKKLPKSLLAEFLRALYEFEKLGTKKDQ